MYAEMGGLLGISKEQEDQLIQFISHDTRIQIAALLYHVVMVDGRGLEEKLKCYREILQDHMNVEPDEMRLFEKMTRERFGSRTSPLAHVKTVSKMSPKIRKDVIHLMKEISLSDNELHEFEINLLVKTARSFGLPPTNALFEHSKAT